MALATDKKSGLTHRPHRAAPGAVEYRGIAIHVKGRDHKLEKLLAKSKKAHSHEHEHKEEAKS